jgi:preprotein translocase subunit YajC
MANGWILAEAQPAGPNNTEVISAEDISSQGQQVTQTTTKQAEPNNISATGDKRSVQNQWSQMILIVLIFVILYFVMFRGPKKRQQQQENMIKSLKKNDRVQTVGGILGTVLDVSDNEITLKVDESNNTKIKVTPSAISKVFEQK